VIGFEAPMERIVAGESTGIVGLLPAVAIDRHMHRLRRICDVMTQNAGVIHDPRLEEFPQDRILRASPRSNRNAYPLEEFHRSVRKHSYQPPLLRAFLNIRDE